MTVSLQKSAKNAETPGWQRFLKDFWKGFTDLSGLSLAVCAGMFAISLVAGLYLYSPRTMAGQWGDYIPRSSTDADAFTTVEAVRLGATKSENPRLLIVGSSTLAQAFGPAQTLLSELENGTGLDWDVHMLTTPMQSPLDQLTLLETALAGQQDGDPPVVIVIGAGISRVTWTSDRQIQLSEQPRIGLRSDWADAELQRLGGTPAPRSAFYVAENRDFVLLNGMKSLTRAIFQHPATRKIDVFAHGKTRENRQEMLTQRVISSIDNLPAYLEQHARIATLIATVPNATLVMIDEPFLPDPAQKTAFDQANDLFQNEINYLASTEPLHYWPIVAEAELSPHHYYDPLHVLQGDAQTLCQTTLAERLTALSRTNGVHDG